MRLKPLILVCSLVLCIGGIILKILKKRGTANED